MKAPKKTLNSPYANYVEHPRYGKAPRFTGVDPNPYDPDVYLHSNATNIHEIQKRATQVFGKPLSFLKGLERITPHELDRITGTAIPADLSKQTLATLPVTHYYDVKRVCRDCKRPFIFFAAEQKYWYEDLNFPVDSDCVKCVECRKREQTLARHRAAYERLAETSNRDWKLNLEMASSAVELVEHGIFGSRVLQRVRQLLKTVPQSERGNSKYTKLMTRVAALSETAQTKSTSNGQH